MLVGRFGVIVIVLRVSRFGISFEGATGTQRCAFPARAPMWIRPRAAVKDTTASTGRVNTSSNGTGVCRHGQTGGMGAETVRIAKGTLLLSGLRLTDVQAAMARICSRFSTFAARAAEALERRESHLDSTGSGLRT